MAFRFWRRVKIAPGVSLNLSKSGGSLSFGPRGAKYTVGPRGTRQTVGIPGTGMYYTTTQSRSGAKGRSRSGQAPAPEPAPEARLTLGFFRKLFTPPEEQAFVDGMREILRGCRPAALMHMRQAAGSADGAFMAGILSLALDRIPDAETHLKQARSKHAGLGRLFAKYGVQPLIGLYITEHVAAAVDADMRGVLLALAEAHQKMDRWREAFEDLKALYQRDTEDVVVRLSLAELLVEEVGGQRAWQQAVRLAEGVQNASQIHAALLMFRAKALRGLGLPEAARNTLTAALRRTKDRPAELLRQIRYERALAYEDLGHAKRARSDWERIYAEAPDFEDVGERLGLPKARSAGAGARLPSLP